MCRHYQELCQNIPLPLLHITAIVQKNREWLQDNLRELNENSMKEGIEWEKVHNEDEVDPWQWKFGLPRLLFVPFDNVEPVQFGNPAERRLLEIPDARVCTVHCLCDRQAKHFRSSYYSRINILLMPLRREKVHVRHFYFVLFMCIVRKGLRIAFILSLCSLLVGN